jgi:transposase
MNRGLTSDFLRLVARKYRAIVAEGERYPAKELALSQQVDKSTLSRWLKAARERGFLGEDAR